MAIIMEIRRPNCPTVRVFDDCMTDLNRKKIKSMENNYITTTISYEDRLKEIILKQLELLQEASLKGGADVSVQCSDAMCKLFALAQYATEKAS